MADNVYKQMGRKVAQMIEEPLRESMIARRVMMFDTRYPGLGVSNIQTPYYADMKEAEIMYRLPDGTMARDRVEPSIAETRIVSIVEGFQVPRDEFEAFRDKGVMMDTANAMSATEKVIQRENELLLKGWQRDGTAYEIKGLAEAEGTNAIGNYDFGTYGNALKKVAEGKAALTAAGVTFTACNLLLNPTQYAQLDASVSTGGIEEYSQVLRQLNPNGGTAGAILQNSDISENHGLLLPYDPMGKYFRAYMPHPLTVSFGTDSTIGEDLSPIYGHALERIGLRVSHSTAICKLSNV